MRPDIITTIGRTVIQHGPLNDRIYVMKLHPGDLPDVIDRIDALAHEQGYSRVFAKVPASVADQFSTRGYVTEACIPGFFNGQEDGHIMGRYYDPARGQAGDPRIARVLSAVSVKVGDRPSSRSKEGPSCEMAAPSDAPEIAALYREVFATYPFPVTDPAYIVETTGGSIRYFYVREEGRIVAASSAEMDRDARNVEMTDFGTLPGYRGRGSASRLLQAMEEAMREEGMLVAYTIARASSFSINFTFARAGYVFAGTLVNNTNICGGFESMNVWYKRL